MWERYSRESESAKPLVYVALSCSQILSLYVLRVFFVSVVQKEKTGELVNPSS